MLDNPEDTVSTISEKKIEANRRNSQKSTGPRTEAGRKQSRRNAMKHGIFSSVLLVESAEDCPTYKKFSYDWRREWNPVGPTEELLVEDFAVLEWRRRRCLQWEARIIRDQVLIQPNLIDSELLKDLSLGTANLTSPCPKRGSST